MAAVQPGAIPLTAEQLFDAVGPAYESAFAGLGMQIDSIKWVLSKLEATGIKRAQIVDIGCGTGKPVCSAFADAGHDVLGIDVSGAMLEAARKQVPNAKFEKLDVRNFNSSDATCYDAVTVYFSMIAGLEQEEIRRSFERFYSWLRPGGLLVFATVPVAGNNVTISWLGKPVSVSGFEADDIVGFIKAAGFEVVHQNVSQFLPKGAEAGICKSEEVWEEPHLFVYATKH